MNKIDHKDKNSADTILKSAKELFVEKGFEGTSISDIASKAEVTKSLIYHHFQNKVNLWKMVKQEIFQTTSTASFENLNFSKDNFYTFVKQFINFRFSLYNNNPAAARMMLWQRLESDPQELTGLVKDNIVSFISYIESFQAIGQVKADISAEFIHYFITTNASSIFLDKPEFIVGEAEEKNKLLYLNMLIDITYKAFKAI